MKRSMLRNGFVLLAALVILPSIGCFQPEPPRPEQLSRGYVLLLPGVESEGYYMLGTIAGLRDGGVKQAIDMDMWGVRPFGSLPNLTAYAANRREAKRLAGKIVDYHREHPESPVTIIGYSGGGGMALFTTEALPEDVKIQRIVLIGAAISPQYDLEPTLRRCRQGVVNFYSHEDWVQIGLGTEVFGTMDRQKTVSAGYIGFEESTGELLVRAGLEQVPWRKDWRRLGHGGDHFGWLARDWAREVLAPVVRLDAKAGG